MDEWVGGQVDRCMDELIDFWMDGWVDGWMDHLIHRWTDKMHSSLGLGSQSLIWALVSPTPAPTDSVASGYSPGGSSEKL